MNVKSSTEAAELIPRQSDPENEESPPSIFDRFLTPAELFYVRNHFETPRIDGREWRLTVEGGARRVEFDMTALRSMERATLTATLECAGNSRALLEEKAKGVQWALGAVGTAEWTGVWLADVLERAEPAGGVKEVILEGADRGAIDEEPKTPGEIAFARSIPLEKARDVLLAWAMNGEDLPERHGYPLRAIVPGWYGMASVKWLRRMALVEQPFQGYFQTFEYSRWVEMAGYRSLAPLHAGEVKAEIAAPAAGEAIGAGTTYRVRGAAWAGESAIQTVEVSANGGGAWDQAQLLDRPARYCWTRWQYDWRTPSGRGRATLMARARDASGRVQPLERNKLERSYAVSHVLPVDVMIT